MPRPRGRPPQAHPAAAASAAETQAKHPPAPLRPQNKTENATTASGNRMTPFKKGFEMDTEKELAQAFSRPPRICNLSES